MIIGAHAVIVLKLPSADEGGYVIFGLPPAELSLHEADRNDKKAFVAEMAQHGIACAAAQEGWGILTSLTLPGGGKLSVYQPRHQRPK